MASPPQSVRFQSMHSRATSKLASAAGEMHTGAQRKEERKYGVETVSTIGRSRVFVRDRQDRQTSRRISDSPIRRHDGFGRRGRDTAARGNRFFPAHG